MKNKLVKRVIILILLLSTVAIYINSYNKDKGLRVISWEDNIYDENNLTLYYENVKGDVVDKRLSNLEKTYKVKELIKVEEREIDKILKIVDILNTVVTWDGVSSSLHNSGYDILKDIGERKKVSERDMAIIGRDLLQSAGYEGRVGEFRMENPQFNSKSSCYVLEYWSPKYNKWIMVDFKDRGYVAKGEELLSSYEILENEIKTLNYNGKSKEKDYFKKHKKYFYSYTIAIDNTLDSKRSNSFITLIKSDNAIDLKLSEKEFTPPTIYTRSSEVFKKSPWNHEGGNDEKAYIILKKKGIGNDLSEEEKKEAENTFVVGGFKNSSIMSKYYLSVNDEPFEEVEAYKEVTFKEGKNTIALSLDGQTSLSKIEVVRDK